MGELPDFPHLFELPGRGAGSDMIGRTAALLVDLHVDLQPAGWRLVDRPGRDERSAVSALRADLDALEAAANGYTGALKAQITGPWTLAASLERTRGGRVLADRGARRDVAQSLAEGLAQHIADVARRVPGAVVVGQVDEPGLPAVLAGSLPTESGFGRLGAVPATEAESELAAVLAEAGEWPVVHCCAANPPVGIDPPVRCGRLVMRRPCARRANPGRTVGCGRCRVGSVAGRRTDARAAGGTVGQGPRRPAAAPVRPPRPGSGANRPKQRRDARVRPGRRRRGLGTGRLLPCRSHGAGVRGRRRCRSVTSDP